MKRSKLTSLLSAFSLIILFAMNMTMTGCSDDKSNGPSGATISGTVKNSANVPLANIIVTISTTPTAKADTTGATGIYEFTEVPVGNYTLTFSGTDYVTTTTTINVVEDDPVVTVGATTIPATSEQTGTISGTVTGGGGNLENAEVKIIGSTASTGRTAKTAANGTYSFTGVFVGTYTVAVERDGYVSDSTTGVTVTANATATTNFAMTQSVILSGNLTTALTLDPSIVYKLNGPYQIVSGAVLTIPAGTRIEAVEGSGAVIITIRATASNATTVNKANGKIYALGTAAEPIVFTTERSAGTRTRGMWGGIVLNGVAGLNVPGGIGVGEGNTGSYGPGFGSFTLNSSIGDTMSSGIFQYVRVEFGGTKVTPDNEVNGWTFNAVGSNTVLDHIQSHMIADDGFEWFGGTVKGKYLVASGCDDDMFDTDFGTQVKLQHVFGIQDQALGNRGMEADNDATGSANTPISKPTVWNFTFVGGNGTDDKNNDDNNEGMYWRRNTQYDANNGIVSYFNRIGLTLDGTADSTNAANGTATAKNMIMWNNSSNITKHVKQIAFKTTAQNYDTIGLRATLDANFTNILVQNPNFTSVTTSANANPFDGNMPNPVPTSVVTGGTPPNDGFFDVSATYIGAFNTTNWLTGWTTWAKN
ncbi:carboxypeptidase regulatory-like domain-containing protein [bacterium]|nr:MAG: carboxypeptidase regulatory-like domain-containing protein [bacterium]